MRIAASYRSRKRKRGQFAGLAAAVVSRNSFVKVDLAGRPWHMAASILGIALLAGVITPAHATLLFSDDFAYASGPLAGNGGGTGWQTGSSWTGGGGSNGNLVAGPMPGTDGTSVRISLGAAETSRPLATTYASGGQTSYYISFGFNANPFQGGNGQYAGVAVYLASDRSNNLFMGMPGDAGGFGYDWTNHGSEAATAANNTTYLALYEVAAGTNSNTTRLTMYASTDLLLSGADLMQTTPWFSLDNETGFSFDSVGIAGGYNTGSIGIAGLAMADNANEAVAFTHTAVPEPTVAVVGVACLSVASAIIRRRCVRTKCESGRRIA